MNLLPIAIAALSPVMIGPLPAQGASLTMGLCNGGTITMPLDQDPPAQGRDCHPKGCHAGACRPKAPKRPNPAI
jgi:hypothetical protein